MVGDVGNSSTGRIKRDLIKVNLNGSCGSGMKSEEENAALASKG